MSLDDVIQWIRILLFTIIAILTPNQYLHEYQEPVARYEPTPTATPTARPKPKASIAPKKHARPAHSITGRAKWYATGRDGLYAAAGPALRKALGDWRGRRVLVCYRKRCEEVVLNDFCRCTGRPQAIIDLSDEVFRYLAPLSRGVIEVTVGY